MRLGALLVVVWLLIGVAAAAQRDYFGEGAKNCSRAATIAATIAVGPLNYVGLDPKVSCEVPEPS